MIEAGEKDFAFGVTPDLSTADWASPLASPGLSGHGMRGLPPRVIYRNHVIAQNNDAFSCVPKFDKQILAVPYQGAWLAGFEIPCPEKRNC